MPQKSTEHHGTGQSGYTAGRTDDPAIEREVQTRPVVGPKRTDEQDVGDDDRFHGKGGPLAPKPDPK